MATGIFGKPLQAIEEADLQSLGQDQIPEGLTIEYKRELNLGQTEQKREAAKDVSALANSNGGRIFYGISETRLPTAPL